MFVAVKATTNPQIHLNKLGYNLSSLRDSVTRETFKNIQDQHTAESLKPSKCYYAIQVNKTFNHLEIVIVVNYIIHGIN